MSQPMYPYTEKEEPVGTTPCKFLGMANKNGVSVHHRFRTIAFYEIISPENPI